MKETLVIKITDSMITQFHGMLLKAIKEKKFEKISMPICVSNDNFDFSFSAIPLKNGGAFVFVTATLNNIPIDFIVFSQSPYRAEDVTSSVYFSSQFKKYLEGNFLAKALSHLVSNMELETNFIIKVIKYKTFEITDQMISDLYKNHENYLNSNVGQNFLTAGGVISSNYTLINLPLCKLKIRLFSYIKDSLTKHKISLIIQSNNMPDGSMEIESSPIEINGLDISHLIYALNKLTGESLPENIFEMMQHLGLVINLKVPMILTQEVPTNFTPYFKEIDVPI